MPIQKTSIPKEGQKRKWFLVDVGGKPLGKTATKIADALRGKNKPSFTPQLDCGDYIVVLNAAKIRLAGTKMDTKLYQWHTRYPGGFRQRTAREMMAKKPESILFKAVWGMMPRNKLRKYVMKKLKIFSGSEHTLHAQAPKPLDL